MRFTIYLLFGAVSMVLLIACANTAMLQSKATARSREVAVRVAVGGGRARIVRQLVTETLLLALIAGALGLALAYAGSEALIALAPADVPRLAETGLDGSVLGFALVVSVATSLLCGLVPALSALRIDLNSALKEGGTRSVVGGGAARLARVSTLPGVAAAGATMAPPGRVESSVAYFVDRMPEQPNVSGPTSVISVVAPGTFAALGIPITSGRDFTDADTHDAPFVAVVNEALVRQSFGGETPIGRTIVCPFDSLEGMTIVGVVGDVRQHGPAREPMPECYMPYLQHRYNGTTLSVVVRTAANPTALTEAVRRLARERSPEVPVTFTTLEASLAENVAAPRFRTLLLAVLSAVALCLAIAGVYGVIAYGVRQRSSEIGLRMALGATAGSVLRLILGQGLRITGIGLVLGLLGALAGTRLLATMLFQVGPADPLVLLAVAGLLGLVSLIATYIPSLRAARIDPLSALRRE